MTNIFDKEGNILPNIDVDSITEIEIPDWMTEVPYLDVFKNLTSVVIPDSITEIKDNAFYGCTNLSHIKLSKNLISIGEDAFSYSGLEELEIPDSVTEIKDRAFERCSDLSQIKLSKNLISIGENAFFGCKALTDLEIPDSVTEIKDNAFDGCTSLSHIKLSNNLSSIGYEAFRGCEALSELEIPETVQHIEKSMFSGCPNLQSVTILGSETKVDERAFEYCPKILTVPIVNDFSEIAFNYSRPQELHVIGDVDNPNDVESLYKALNWLNIKLFAPWDGKTYFCNHVFKSENGWMFDEETQTTFMLIMDAHWEDYKESTYELSGKQLIMPDLPNIYQGLFSEICPPFPTTHPDYPLILPSKLKTIKARTFSGEHDVTNISSIRLPNGLEIIEAWAFYASGLGNVTIPSSVKEIGDGAFCFNYGLEHCYNHSLESIRFEGKVKNISAGAITETGEIPEGLKTIIVPKGLKEYYMEKLSDCKGIEDIIVEE